MKLHTEILGDGHPLIILHGLYGSGQNWLTLGRRLAQFCKVFLPDQRNHGVSPHAPSHNYHDLTDDLLQLFQDQNLDRAIILGHSMGGKVAMQLAVQHPGKVSKLIIADISPLGYRAQPRLLEQYQFHRSVIQALMDLDLNGIRSLGDADHALTSAIHDKSIRQFLLKNLDRRNENGYKWKLNLPVISEYLEAISEGLPSEIIAEGNYRKFPALFIRGERSPYVMEADLEAIRHLFPLAAVSTIKNAGHWLHAEQPEQFYQLVKSFILS